MLIKPVRQHHRSVIANFQLHQKRCNEASWKFSKKFLTIHHYHRVYADHIIVSVRQCLQCLPGALRYHPFILVSFHNILQHFLTT